MLLIKGATVYTMELDQPLENCDILIENGKIADIGCGLAPRGATSLDASGLTVLPGLVDAHSHMGGMESMSGQDVAESTEAIMPEVNVAPSIDVHSPLFAYYIREGVTTCCIVPGSHNVIAGTGLVAKTWGESIYEMIIKNPAVMKCAMGENVKNALGGRGIPPKTRMGIASLFRGALLRARSYRAKKEDAENNGTPLPPYDEKSEALIPVLKREMPLKVHCTNHDMLTLIDIAREFKCDYTIEHGFGCGSYVDELLEGGGSLLFGPFGSPDAYGEMDGADVAQIYELDAHGLNIALITDAPISGPENLVVYAGEAVRMGIPHIHALRMITINPAVALGVEDRVGSIKIGKDADLAIFEGTPALDMGACIKYTIANGELVYRR